MLSDNTVIVHLIKKGNNLMEDNKRTYTVKEIQKILEVSKPTAYRIVESGAFRSIKIGGSIRVSKKSFDEWLDNLENGDDYTNKKCNLPEPDQENPGDSDLKRKESVNEEVGNKEVSADQAADVMMLLSLMRNPETAKLLRSMAMR